MNGLLNNHANNSGFTLVELMVTLVVAFVLSAAVYATYKVQLKTATAQDQVIEAQQNIRAAMYRLSRDLRMAGHDPEDSGTAGVLAASAGRIRFTQDITGAPITGDSDGDVDDAGETIEIRLANDADGDGDVDGGGIAAIEMDINDGNGFQAIAENIEQIQFFYTLTDGTTTLAPAAAQLAEIVTVTVSLLARAENLDPGYVNSTVYTLGDGNPLPAVNDNFRRRLLINEVVCRNMAW